MTGLALLGCLAAGALLAITGLAAHGRDVDPLARVRARLLLGGGAVLALLVLVVPLNGLLPQLQGVPFVVAPALAAAAALLAFTVGPWRRAPSDGLREATVRPRSTLRVLGTGGALAIGAPLVALVAVVAACCAVSDADGRSLTVRRPHLEATSSFPGWLLGLPVLLAVAVLVAAAVLALRRATLLPAVQLDPERDLRWRRSVARAVVLVVDVALLLELTWATWSVQGALRALGAGSAGRYPGDPLLTGLGDVARQAAPLCGLAAVVLLVAAIAQAAAVGRRPQAAAVPA